MRLETSHYRCDRCGYLTHCCEGDLAPYLPPDDPVERDGVGEDETPKTRRSAEAESTVKK
jgi:hypothetical protein